MQISLLELQWQFVNLCAANQPISFLVYSSTSLSHADSRIVQSNLIEFQGQEHCTTRGVSPVEHSARHCGRYISPCCRWQRPPSQPPWWLGSLCPLQPCPAALICTECSHGQSHVLRLSQQQIKQGPFPYW